jgi:hypothetical protein
MRVEVQPVAKGATTCLDSTVLRDNVITDTAAAGVTLNG